MKMIHGKEEKTANEGDIKESQQCRVTGQARVRAKEKPTLQPPGNWVKDMTTESGKWVVETSSDVYFFLTELESHAIS